MATGEKLPNTNLNLIQDSDVIDNADINAIAQAVEAKSKPVEGVLTADKFSTVALKLYRVGSLCFTAGHYSFTEAIPTQGYHTLGSVPAGFRPNTSLTAYAVSASTHEPVALRILASGEIGLYNFSANTIRNGTALSANLTWITND